MTSVQKIIKYVAIAFAIFLIVNIISAIIFGFYVLGNIVGISNNKENIITEDLEVISSETTEISTLRVDLDFTNLQIKTGDKFKIETNNSKIDFSEKNGKVVIKEATHNLLLNKPESSLIIYLPEDMLALDEVKIDNKAGTIDIENVKAQTIYLNIGAGEVHIENIDVSKKMKIDGGAGRTEIEASEIYNLDANLGVGEFIFSGKLMENSNIDSGVGAIKINLMDNIDNYTIDVSKGLGSIKIDGKNIESDRIYGAGDNYIKVNGGVGAIEIK